MGGTLRILTANLFNGRTDPDVFAEIVQAARADVVAVQELSPEQAEPLARLLPFGSLYPDRVFNGKGIALARRASVRRIALGHRELEVARLDPADWPELAREVEVLNLHVSSPTGRPFWAQPGRRHRQLRTVLAHLDDTPHDARVLVGDFNATPLWPVYRRIAARLDDMVLLHARRRGESPARTWRPDGCWYRGPRLLRIDHCFARGLDVEHVETHVLPGSDHDALLVELRLA